VGLRFRCDPRVAAGSAFSTFGIAKRTAPDKTGHKFGQPRDGAPLGDGATKPGDYGGDTA
jgi:hypothetical protein